MALTDISIKALKPSQKSYITADGQGLCLQITPIGLKLWRYRYRYLGKARVLTVEPDPCERTSGCAQCLNHEAFPAFADNAMTAQIWHRS
jgi:Arm DNA-binding domain